MNGKPISRAEALRRAAAILGGTLSASTVAGVLAGCERRSAPEGAAWSPSTLTDEQSEMVLVMGELIIPETDTPGARTARVDQYVDAMLTEFYPQETRQRFLTGLDRVDAHARRLFGSTFLDASPEEQRRLTYALNEAAFRRRTPSEAVPAPAEDPVLLEGDVQTGNEETMPPPDQITDPQDVGRESFFRMLKELVVVGYYTSEAGATQELALNPMGSWRADLPYSEIGQAWT